MIKLLKRFKLAFVMLAVAAGVFCFLCGFSYDKKIPKNVTVNGMSVGGLSIADAAGRLRAETEEYLRGKSLEICAGDKVYKYTYPEIYYRDNLFRILKNAKKGKSYTAETSYYLCGAEELAQGICLAEQLRMTEPYAKFSAYGKPFEYCEGNDGRRGDAKALVKDINNSLNGGFERVNVKFTRVPRTKTIEDVKSETRLLSSFTTRFDGGNLNRVSNIRLAASKINGTVLEGGKTLSFNDIVGARVKERGFLTAKIIENGEFTEGVGGGVCQVSTTLYNAALLSGLKIEEFHPHTLAVGYVPPSRDAMVSGKAFDLKIKNNGKTPIYIRANTTNGSVTFDIYGKSDGAKYSLKSSVTGNIPAPEEATDDPDKARSGKDGLISEGYLEIMRAGVTKSVLLRKDKYKPVKRITYEAKPDGIAEENSAEEG